MTPAKPGPEFRVQFSPECIGGHMGRARRLTHEKDLIGIAAIIGDIVPHPG